MMLFVGAMDHINTSIFQPNKIRNGEIFDSIVHYLYLWYVYKNRIVIFFFGTSG